MAVLSMIALASPPARVVHEIPKRDVLATLGQIDVAGAQGILELHSQERARVPRRPRGDRDVPPGRYASSARGGSFTLGYGVGDADTWCALLQTIDPRLETVNMGQAGYGLDQALSLVQAGRRRRQAPRPPVRRRLG